MQAFGGKPDGTAQTLSFIDSNLTIPAVVAMYANSGEAAVRIFSTAQAAEDTLALEPRKATAEDVTSQQKYNIFWQHIAVARTVCIWAVGDKSAMIVQIENPSDQAVIIRANIALGKIVPVKAVPARTISAVTKTPKQETTKEQKSEALNGAF